MIFEVGTLDHVQMARILAARLPNTDVHLNRHYNIDWFEYMGDANHPGTKVKPFVLTEMKVGEEGASEGLCKTLCAYNGGIDLKAKEPHLVVCDDFFTNSGILTMPAKLFIKHLFRFREVEEVVPGITADIMSLDEIIKKSKETLETVEDLPDRFYDAKWAEYRGYRGEKDRVPFRIKAAVLAELQVREKGASGELDKTLCAYVGGINLKAPKPFLVICDDIFTDSGILTVPAKLPLENLIGYRVVEKK